MKNILLKISYDGTGFNGWQRQPGQRTVQGVLEEVLSELCREEIKINGTSRTDAGVHACGQQASFCADIRIPVDRIKVAVNNSLPGDIRLKEVREVPLDFHARFDAKGKKYCYKIRNCAEEDVFNRNYCYNIQKPLDISAMQKAAGYFAGTHDFKSFMAAGGQERDSTVRTIYSLKVIGYEPESEQEPIARHDPETEQEPGTRQEPEAGSERGTMQEHLSGKGSQKNITVEVTGNGFLYNMVRIITGTLVDAGLGKIEPASIPRIIEAKDRNLAGHTAPPQGLYLSEVYFEDGENSR